MIRCGRSFADHKAFGENSVDPFPRARVLVDKGSLADFQAAAVDVRYPHGALAPIPPWRSQKWFPAFKWKGRWPAA